ncbi:MAG: AAA family ATPase [Dehalococcoidales bacterium]|nr:AAA family ATPase [Dehalococcoidales bacterium]
MSEENERVKIERLATGVPGLDEVLGGGLPEYSFNLIAGGPGTGKTMLAHQIVFANATADRPALYFTVLGEPTLKMLRYQQQMAFFDHAKVGDIIRFINLSDIAADGNLAYVLETIVQAVEEAGPGIVVVDSFRTLVRTVGGGASSELEMQNFVQRLALYLTSWEATTFLLGEYGGGEQGDNPVFTVADGILWLHRSVKRNSIVRKLEVVKMRGQAPQPGLQTFRITDNGLSIFPRIPQRIGESRRPVPERRASTGLAGLDEMLGGGIPEGDAALIAGPSGSGKSVFATQFIAKGVERGEPGIIAVFEEHPFEYQQRALSLGFDLDAMVRQGRLRVINLRPLDLSVDETLHEIVLSVHEVRAKRVVIDSLSGFELALAPTFRTDFRESLYRLVGMLTGLGITVLMTMEVVEDFGQLRFSAHEISFVTDDIILQRYVEVEGELHRVITVVKMRSSDHSKALREYQITPHGIVVGEKLGNYRGIITGVPQRVEAARPAYPGLTAEEAMVLRALIELREGTAEAVAQATHLPRSEATAALNRLVALSYIIRVGDGGQAVFRPVEQAL